jgi:hypothetical protein
MKTAPRPSRGLLPEALRKLEQEHLRQLDSGLQAVLDAIQPEDEGDAMEPLPFTLRAGRSS